MSHAAPLGQTIGLFYTAAEAFPAGVSHCFIHRRSAPKHKSEPREVVLRHHRVPTELQSNRRRECDARCSILLQELQESLQIEAGHEDERGASVEVRV